MNKIIMLIILFIFAFASLSPLAADCSGGCETAAPMTYDDLEEALSSTGSELAFIEDGLALLERRISKAAGMHIPSRLSAGIVSSLAEGYIGLVHAYLDKLAQMAWLETLCAHTESTDDGLLVVPYTVPTDEKLAQERNASEAAYLDMLAAEAQLLAAEDIQSLQAGMQPYQEAVDGYAGAQSTYLEDYYLVQMSLWIWVRTPVPRCPGKTTPLTGYTSYEMTDFTPVRVWVGNYSSEIEPDVDCFIGEQCYGADTFDTDLAYYWNKKVAGTKSIQVKFFYYVYIGKTKHSVIWEMNKNSQKEWPTEGYAKFKTIMPPDGWYRIGDPCKGKMTCCSESTYGWTLRWCNDHCGGCFACDPSGCQYFIIKNA